MKWISARYPFWNNSNGRDHVYVFAQGFAARLAGNWSKYNNGIFMVHNGEFTAPEYTPHKDITIPPELRGYLQPYWTTRHGTKHELSKKYVAHFGGQRCPARTLTAIGVLTGSLMRQPFIHFGEQPFIPWRKESAFRTTD
ncbi:Glycosyltransferase family GT47 [Gracilaria domingensis]|nr:Glycosyltransferase family GT47 [Gracilaria domingensis]